jgi:2-polyprenyl-3-methyl-5-hydroxy-6-metoxy-1,4-benzoquinol methylase
MSNQADPVMDARKLDEISFHDQYERDRATLSAEEYERKYPNRKWYSITRRSAKFIDTWLRSHVRPGTVVLDYCCGQGGTSLQLAMLGGTVH